ncbi:MAG: hypothetical protein HYV63_30840 [Candidatus Schekmanbacteria bacterium]|nr:hypothetical protein [Candidatus Schekmanbacteria bacterium]
MLACVVVRFIEDNELIERLYLSGPGDRLIDLLLAPTDDPTWRTIEVAVTI